MLENSGAVPGLCLGEEGWGRLSEAGGSAGPPQAAAAGLDTPARAGTGVCTISHIFRSLRHFPNCYLKPAAGFQQRSLRLLAASNCIYVLYPLSRINRLAINSGFLTSSWITRSLIIFSVAVNLKSCVTLSESFHSHVTSAALCGNWQPRNYRQNRKQIFPPPWYFCLLSTSNPSSLLLGKYLPW